MALKTVDSFVTSDDLDELIVIGYIRMCEVDISLNIPTTIIDVIHKCYKRTFLGMIGFRRYHKNTNKVRFTWITNKFHLNGKIMDIEADIKPFCIDNIRKYTTGLLNLNIIPSKYMSILKHESDGYTLSGDEHQVINKFYYIYFYELRHSDYVNKQFGLINNSCKAVLLQCVKSGHKNPGHYVIKLPVNIKILSSIILSIAKSTFIDFEKIKHPKCDTTKVKWSLKHIIVGDKDKKAKIIECNDYITTDWNISNDFKVIISILVSIIK